MLVQSSRFFNDEYVSINLKYSDRLYNFFDFASLVESIILYDQLITLEGTIFDDLSNCPLISKLKELNILSNATLPIDWGTIIKKMSYLKSTDRILNDIGERKFDKIQNKIPELLPDDFHVPSPIKDLFSDDSFRMKGIDTLWDGKNPLNTISSSISKIHLSRLQNILEFYKRGELFPAPLGGTGGYGRGEYKIRTLFYQFVATERNLVFYPDYPRIPIIKNLNQYSRHSLTKEIYTWFAERFEAEAEQFLKDKEPINLLIPPFTSILLDRCSTKNDVFQELMNLREEFSELRLALRKLEENQLNCENIKERNQLKAKVDKIFKATAKKYDSNNFISLEESLKLADDVAKPFYNPNDPSSYSASILLLPIEKIKDWYFRRPLNQFFDARKKFIEIKNYSKLVKQVFDIEFSDSEIMSFNLTQKILNSAYTRGK